MADIEVAVEVKAKTDKAWLCFDGKTEAWIPVSQITDYCEEDKITEGRKQKIITSIFISNWLAEKKGFI